jgi:hypothetical protein
MSTIDKTITIEVASVEIKPINLKYVAIGTSAIFFLLGIGIIIAKSKK